MTPEPRTEAVPAAPATIEYAPPTVRATRLGKGFLALAASCYWPGLGQLFAGEKRRGLVWFLASVLLLALGVAIVAVPKLFVGVIVLLPLQIVFTLACAVDAFLHGRRSERRMLGTPPVRYLAGLALLAAALFLNPATPVAILVRENWAEAFVMPTASMFPTVQPGDRIITHKRLGEVHRWDLIVFDTPQDPGNKWLNRVAGLPGETVEVVGGELLVNGSPVTRPQGAGPYEQPRRYGGGNASAGNPLTLGPDEYFMLGDHSAIAMDGRYWDNPAPGHQVGVLPRDRMIGRVTAIYWPPAKWKRF